jgi:cytochrome c oxidase subunit I
LFASIGLLIGALAFAFHNIPIAIAGLGIVFLSCYLWALEGPGGYHIHIDEKGNETITRH